MKCFFNSLNGRSNSPHACCSMQNLEMYSLHCSGDNLSPWAFAFLHTLTIHSLEFSISISTFFKIKPLLLLLIELSITLSLTFTLTLTLSLTVGFVGVCSTLLTLLTFVEFVDACWRLFFLASALALPALLLPSLVLSHFFLSRFN